MECSSCGTSRLYVVCARRTLPATEYLHSKKIHLKGIFYIYKIKHGLLQRATPYLCYIAANGHSLQSGTLQACAYGHRRGTYLYTYPPVKIQPSHVRLFSQYFFYQDRASKINVLCKKKGDPTRVVGAKGHVPVELPICATYTTDLPKYPACPLNKYTVSKILHI